MQFKKLTKEQKEYITNQDGGWIVRNLLYYGDSLVPREYVKQYGFDTVKSRLERITGYPVKIEKSVFANKKYFDYIATVHR